MKPVIDTPALTKLFTDGYGEDMMRTVTHAIEYFALSLSAPGNNVTTESDADNLVNLVWLQRAILKDCYGINL